MTVSAAPRIAGPFTGNGVATSFGFAFKTFAAADIQVILTVGGVDTTLTTNYTVTLNGDQDANPGGSVTYPTSGSPISSSYRLTILSDMALAQTTDIPEGGAFRAGVVEDALDREVMLVQQVNEKLGRALTIPASAGITSELPSPVPGFALGWNASGTAIINVPVPSERPFYIDVVAGYGADPTGVLDSTAAIQAAIDDVFGLATRGSVYLPPGEYRITSNLQMPYGVSMFGAGGTASLLFAYGCNGIDFITYGTSIGCVFFEDFGITAASGTNWAAITVPTNASSMDGLYFNRLRIYGFNEGILLGATRSATVTNCVFEDINNCISTQGEVIRLRIFNNGMRYSAGGAGSASRYAIDLRSSTFTEGIQIHRNDIYGFDRCVNAQKALALNIDHNELSTNGGRAISFVTAEGGYNITDNYIECLGASIGIYGASQGSDVANTMSNIKHNTIVGSGGSATIGIQLNTSVSTYQWNANIEDNTIYGFATHDMAIYEPGRSSVVNNRCLSSAPTNSILIGNVQAGPVFLDKNWCKKAIGYSSPADVQTGKVVLGQNTQNDTFVPWSGTWTAAYTPTSGAFGTIVYGANTGTYQRIGNLCFFNLTIFETTHTGGTASGDLLITGLPFTAISSPTSATPISVGDSRLFNVNNPSAAQVLAGTTSIKLYHRTTANGANTITQCSDMAGTTGTFNLIVLAGVYECV